MNKIDLRKNEVFSIKGVDGDEYLFDGRNLFLNTEFSVEEDPVNVSVIKSLRTEQGARDWLKVAGFRYPNAQVVDTETLKSYGMKDMDSSAKFHVVDMDDDEEESMEDFKELISGESEMDEESSGDEEGPGQEDHDDEDSDMAVGQLSSILDNAQELRSILESETELEPWVQSKITLAADYLEKLHGYFEHHPENSEDMDEAEEKMDELADEVDTDVDIPGDDAQTVVVEGKPVTVTKVDEDEARKAVNVPPSRSASTGAADPSGEADEIEGNDSGPAFSGGPTNGDSALDEGDADSEDEPGPGDMPGDPNVMRSVVGMTFKSMHAAKQWNRYDNPDKERYYIDIMRSKDNNDPWTRSASLNAKYIVRDRQEIEPDVIKGAYGNKKVKNSKIYVPEKKLDADVKRVAAITQEKVPPVKTTGNTPNAALMKNAEEAGKGS